MSLAAGRHYLAIPGPSVMPDRVLQAMHRGAPNIYTGALIDMFATIPPALKKIAGTRHHAVVYIANGHGVWEAAIANTLNRGDKVLVLATGRFAMMWGDMSNGMGIKPHYIDFGLRDAIDPDQVTAALRADKFHEIKAVMACQVDTSTSVKNDIAALRRAIDAADHPALLMVDCIASLASDHYEMDAWGVDVTVAACQKGLMTPPGMGFLFFNDKADAARSLCTHTSRYWDWRPRMAAKDFSQNFNGTAPTHHLYGLREALDMIAEEGLENILARHQKLADAYRAAITVWGQGGPMELNVINPDISSNAVTSVRIGAPYGTQLREWLSENMGVTLGIGLGMATSDDPESHGFFRIGHMGHVNAHMVLGTIGAIDAALKALNVPHGDGALAAATHICATA